jgi:hypothetical protein
LLFYSSPKIWLQFTITIHRCKNEVQRVDLGANWGKLDIHFSRLQQHLPIFIQADPFSVLTTIAMTTHTVPLEALQKVRQYLKGALVLPESENRPRLIAMPLDDEDDVLPTPGSLADLGDLFRVGSTLDDGVPMPNDQGQWFLSVMEPNAVMLKLPHLSLKPNYRLVTYLYRLRESGCGKTWALPEHLATTAHLDAVITDNSHQIEQPPCPYGALPDLMAAIEGDQQPMSFMVASILRRELEEFGSLGTHQQWSQHRFVAAAPPQARWQWRTESALDLQPKIRMLPEGQIVVEFFSCRVHPSVAIFQHLDQYEPGSYMTKAIDRPIAFAERRAA